jgi:hypothetical protein
VIDIGAAAEVSRYHWYLQSGYAMGNLPGSARRIGLHVLVWRMSGGAASATVDHRNRNTLDCRLANLRAATRMQNSWNALYRNSTGYTGVARKGRKFRASVMANGVRHWKGGFETAADAARWRDAKAAELRGEFAALNEVH